MASYSNPLTISLNLIQQSEFSENSLGEKRHKNGRGVRQTHQIVYIWEQLGHFQAIIRPRCPSVIKTSPIVNYRGGRIIGMPDQVGHDGLPVKDLLEVVCLRVVDAESADCFVVILSYVVSDVLVVVLSCT